jgi:GH15 family glucan-1,4-alpha-glucosidase
MPQPLDLAVAGNGTVAALIDTTSRVLWLCWPRLDGDLVFCALMDGTDPQHGFAEIDLLRRAGSERERAFVESLDGEGLDAALLLMPEIGIIAPSDPRFVATVEAIRTHLARDRLLLRYDAPDDFGVPDTAMRLSRSWEEGFWRAW